MDALELARHGFQELAILLAGPITPGISDRAEIWIRQEVLPVSERLHEEPRFRRHAQWSLDRLLPGAETSERRLVEAVDRALVEAASAVSEASRHLAVRDAAPGFLEPDDLTVVDWAAGRPWSDLACIKDYFLPPDHLNSASGTAEWHRELSTEVTGFRVLGDNVCRGVLGRIEFFRRRVDRLRRACLSRMLVDGRGDDELLLAVSVRHAGLEEAIAALRDACGSGPEPGLRDACVTLVQVYAAYSDRPQLEWLGCDRNTASAFGGLLRHYIRAGISMDTEAGRRLVPLVRPDVLRMIAAALDAVAPLYRRPAETEDLVEGLRSKRRLLLVDCVPRSVYWDGGTVEFNWDSKAALWELLWKLADRARQRKTVDRQDFGGGKSSLKHRRSRLAAVIPASLDELIIPFPPGGYRLRLEPGEIALLTLDSYEQPVELGLDLPSGVPR